MEYFRCDSCKKIWPAELMKTIKYSFSKMDGKSKEDLSTEKVFGMICSECGKTPVVNTKTKSYSTKKEKPY